MGDLPPDRRRAGLILIAAAGFSALWIGVNSGKPFHIDDPLFIYWARTIAPLPGETPVENVNWERFDEPLYEQVRTKGPGWSLLLVITRRLWGDSEAAGHWLQWPFAAMFLAGAAILARHFGAPPWPVFLLCASSPLFLVPATSVMPDLACVGPGVLGFALWLGASSLRTHLVAGFLIALAGQMKPAIFPLLPLLFFDTSGRIVREPRRLSVAAGTCFLAGLYPRLPPISDEGRSVLDQVLFILNWSWQRGGFWLPKTGYALATLSALAIFPAACALGAFVQRRDAAPYARSKAFGVAVMIFLALSAAGFWKGFEFPGGSFASVDTGPNTLWFYGSVVCFLAWAIQASTSGTIRPARWLAAWLLLVFAGSVVGTPNPAARAVVFATPALATLFVLDLRRHLAPRGMHTALAVIAAGNAWLGISLVWNDHAFARFCRESAGRGHALATKRGLPLVTTGQWGLRLYVERMGGAALGSEADALANGAVLLHPVLTDHRPLPSHLARRIRARQTWEAPVPSALKVLIAPWRTVPPPETSAAFHGGHVWLPFAAARGPVERVEALEIAPPAAGR